MYQCGLILTYAPDELASGEESGIFQSRKKNRRRILPNLVMIYFQLS